MKITKINIDPTLYRIRKVSPKIAKRYYEKGEEIYSPIGDEYCIFSKKDNDAFLILNKYYVVEPLQEDVVIVSKYQCIIDYFLSKGIKGKIITTKVKRSDIKNKIVYGTLPTLMLEYPKEIYMPIIPFSSVVEKRLDSISYQELESYGMYIKKLQVDGETVKL